MTITNLKICKGFDRVGDRGRTIFTVKKSLINSQIYYRHDTEINNSRKIKICHQTKLGVLNPNSWSKISFEESFKKVQNDAVN